MMDRKCIFLMVISLLMLFVDNVYAQEEAKPNFSEDNINICYNIASSDDERSYGIGQLASSIISRCNEVKGGQKTINIIAQYKIGYLKQLPDNFYICKEKGDSFFHYVKSNEKDSLMFYENKRLDDNLEKELYKFFLLKRQLKQRLNQFDLVVEIDDSKHISKNNIQILIASKNNPKKRGFSESMAETTARLQKQADRLKDDIGKRINNKPSPPEGKWTISGTWGSKLRSLKASDGSHLKSALKAKVRLNHVQSIKKYIITNTYSNDEINYIDTNMIVYVEKYLKSLVHSIKNEIKNKPLTITLKTETNYSDGIINFDSDVKYNKEFDKSEDFIGFPYQYNEEKPEEGMNIIKRQISLLEQEFLKLYFVKEGLVLDESDTVNIIIESKPNIEEVRTTIIIEVSY